MSGRLGAGADRSALIVLDMLNRYEHEDADLLLESVRTSLPAMQRMIEQARSEETLTVYVNDNYGDWGAGRSELLERALAGPFSGASCSGASQIAVPKRFCSASASDTDPKDSSFASPKSSSLIRPASVTMMFRGQMSRWR